MEIENKKKKIIVTSIVIGIVLLLGVAYAWFNYYQEGSNQRLIMGDIYLQLDDGDDEIVISNVYPLSPSEAYRLYNKWKKY